MKKNNLNILAVVFLGLNIVFLLAYDLYYAFGYEYGLVNQNMGVSSLSTIIPWIFAIVTTVLLIIGVLKQSKIFFCIHYGYQIIYSFVKTIFVTFQYANVSSMRTYIPINIISGLSSISFNIFMLLFIFIVFNWKEKKANTFNEYNIAENVVGNAEKASPDILLEYKELLDSGAITQDEFDNKKKELLNL